MEWVTLSISLTIRKKSMIFHENDWYSISDDHFSWKWLDIPQVMLIFIKITDTPKVILISYENDWHSPSDAHFPQNDWHSTGDAHFSWKWLTLQKWCTFLQKWPTLHKWCSFLYKNDWQLNDGLFLQKWLTLHEWCSILKSTTESVVLDFLSKNEIFSQF